MEYREYRCPYKTNPVGGSVIRTELKTGKSLTSAVGRDRDHVIQNTGYSLASFL